MQLEMFVAVVEEGSVRRAAERVFRTQPAVSIAVRKLEQEFSAPLFDRSKRYEFRLTQAGEALYRYAKRILSLRNEATSELDDIAKLRVGHLRIGANESISLHLLPRLAQTYLKQHPGTSQQDGTGKRQKDRHEREEGEVRAVHTVPEHDEEQNDGNCTEEKGTDVEP